MSWMQLVWTDLFKNDNVTKKEIVDTIDLNKFQLIEKKRIGKDSSNWL